MTHTERGDVIIQANDVAFSIVTSLPFYPNTTATHYEVHHIVWMINCLSYKLTVHVLCDCFAESLSVTISTPLRSLLSKKMFGAKIQ